MNVGIKVFICAMLMVGGFSASATTAKKDSCADLVKIATRFVENYSKVGHEAGDADGIFIENVVIPSVANVVDSYRGSVPVAVQNELYRFLMAGKSMASEELVVIAEKLYLSSPEQFCRDVFKLSKPDRDLLIRQANDGLAMSRSISKVECLQPKIKSGGN